MKGQDVFERISATRTPEDRFIRWWRKENDFVDYELLSDFLHRLQGNEEFAGFELLDTDTMWTQLKRFAGDRVRRETRTRGDYIIWQRSAGKAQETVQMSYTAESIMHIFNEETQGMTLH
ncbi:MAG: hypothetical protein D6751_01930 [Deltaproteobacteria bacterium]|nr:MAG: hypothetical protein D6751_01930 [Deltaproteobacteria bacterium]